MHAASFWMNVCHVCVLDWAAALLRWLWQACRCSAQGEETCCGINVSRRNASALSRLHYPMKAVNACLSLPDDLSHFYNNAISLCFTVDLTGPPAGALTFKSYWVQTCFSACPSQKQPRCISSQSVLFTFVDRDKQWDQMSSADGGLATFLAHFVWNRRCDGGGFFRKEAWPSVRCCNSLSSFDGDCCVLFRHIWAPVWIWDRFQFHTQQSHSDVEQKNKTSSSGQTVPFGKKKSFFELLLCQSNHVFGD